MQREFIYNDIMYLLYKSYDLNQFKCKEMDPLNLTKNAFNSTNFLMDYPDFNYLNDQYTACLMCYRSKNELNQKNVWNIIREVQRNGNCMKMVEWAPTSIKHSIGNQQEIGKCVENKNEILSETDCSAVMIGNTTAFGRWCNQRITNKFNAMFDRRAFVHWYYADGMEQDQFLETREDLEFLNQDFNDVLVEESDEEEVHYDRNDYVISTMSEQQMIDKALKDSLDD